MRLKNKTDFATISAILISMLTFCLLYLLCSRVHLFSRYSIHIYLDKIKYVHKVSCDFYHTVMNYVDICIFPNHMRLRWCPGSETGSCTGRARRSLELCSLKGSSGFNSLMAQMKSVIVICPRWPRVEDLLKISEGTDANHRNTSDRRRNGDDDNPLETCRAEDHGDMTLKISLNDRDRDVKKGHYI